MPARCHWVFYCFAGTVGGDTRHRDGLGLAGAMMPFLIDTSVTLCLRVAAGHAPHVAHRDHAYQRLALRAGNPLPVTLGLLALQAVWQFPLAVTVSTGTLFPPLVVLLSTIPALLLVVYARRKP